MPAISSALPTSDPPSLVMRSLATPQQCYALAGRLIPWFAWSAALLCGFGLLVGLFIAPSDVQQGEHYRIVFIHGPSMWISVLIYVLMASASGYGLATRHRLASMLASSMAPTGALFAFVALWTGALWGKPAWGVWWVWDARLASELLVLFLFLGFIALQEAIDDPRRADRAAGILALAGMIGLPLLYFSVHSWSVMYGTAKLSLSLPTHAMPSVLSGMLMMSLGLMAYATAAALARLRIVILMRERSSEWVARHFATGRVRP
jgi:heme exporter protein C